MTSHRDAIWKVVAEVYAVHSMMFGCGLTPSEVFVATDRVSNAPTTHRYASVIAIRGVEQFLMWVAPLVTRQDVKAFQKTWRFFAKRQPKIDKSGLDIVLARSEAFRQFPELRLGLIRKGLIGEDAGRELLAIWSSAFELAPQGAPS